MPFNWKDLTPVAMLALDEFVLWVNADAPYKSAKDYLAAVKAGKDHQFKMAGTGSKQEDQIITVALDKFTGKKFTYVPFKGGGDVAVQLVGNHVNSTVNNPIEAVAHWRGGKLRPLCVFDTQRMPYKEKVTDKMSWGDIPTLQGGRRQSRLSDVARHLHARWCQPGQGELLHQPVRKVRELPEWKEFVEKGAFNQSFMSGKEYASWVQQAEDYPQGIDEGCRLPGQVTPWPAARRVAIRTRQPDGMG